VTLSSTASQFAEADVCSFPVGPTSKVGHPLKARFDWEVLSSTFNLSKLTRLCMALKSLITHMAHPTTCYHVRVDARGRDATSRHCIRIHTRKIIMSSWRNAVDSDGLSRSWFGDMENRRESGPPLCTATSLSIQNVPIDLRPSACMLQGRVLFVSLLYGS